MKKESRAFTLMELLITVTLLGIIAAYGVAEYEKAIQKANERDALIQLQGVYGAVKIYEAKHGDFWDPGGGGISSDIDVINATLGTNLVEHGHLTYEYQYGGPAAPAGDEFWASAAYSDGATIWKIRVFNLPISSTNPCCRNPVCPTVPDCS